jgi:hypothetical protein
MKGLFVISLLILTLSLSFVLPSHAFGFQKSSHNLIASYLDDYPEPAGGWEVTEDLYIDTFKSSKTYTISLDRATSRPQKGIPTFKRVDVVEIPIKSDDYSVRGRFVCWRKSIGFPDNSLVVLLRKFTPEKAWLVKDSKLKPISHKNVLCDFGEERGHGE